MPETANDIVVDSLRELRVLNAVDPPGPEDAALGLTRLNGILDLWNADPASTAYADVILSQLLTIGLQPHTIGPSAATWAVDQRPLRILAASVILENDYHRPITVHHGLAWWHRLTDPTLSGDIPTDLAYDPAWPNGNVYFYPEPAAILTVELLVRTVLAQLAAGDPFTLPPGYRRALMLTLAEDLAKPMGVALHPDTKIQAREARDLVFGANRQIPSLETADYGIGSECADEYDYRVGPLG